MADHLSKKGHDVHVYARRKNNDLKIHKNKNFQCTRMFGRNWSQFHFLYMIYYSFLILKRFPKAYIIATTWELATAFKFYKFLFPKAKLSFVAHGLEVTRISNKGSIKKFKNLIKISDLIICVSNFTRKEVLKFCSTKKQKQIVTFIPNGVDPKRFFPDKEYKNLFSKFNIPPNSNILITLARIIRRKGHDTVLKSLPEVLKKFPSTHYLIVGKERQTNYMNELKTLINDLKLNDHVTFTGYVKQDEIRKLYSMSKIYIMVSKYIADSGDSEGFGITFLEANLCGCPVIGSISGGIPDAVEHNINGLLVAPQDHASLSKSILLLLSNNEKRHNLIYQGKERVLERFTWEKITDQIISNYEKSVFPNVKY